MHKAQVCEYVVIFNLTHLTVISALAIIIPISQTKNLKQLYRA